MIISEDEDRVQELHIPVVGLKCSHIVLDQICSPLCGIVILVVEFKKNVFTFACGTV